MKKVPNPGTNHHTNPPAQRASTAATTPQDEGEIKGVPKAAAEKPNPLQITQMATVLRAAAHNRHKSDFELVRQVWALWDATHNFAAQETEKEIILATAAQMTDKEDLLEISK